LIPPQQAKPEEDAAMSALLEAIEFKQVQLRNYG